MTRVTEDIVRSFRKIGFVVADGPDVEVALRMDAYQLTERVPVSVLRTGDQLSFTDRLNRYHLWVFLISIILT